MLNNLKLKLVRNWPFDNKLRVATLLIPRTKGTDSFYRGVSKLAPDCLLYTDTRSYLEYIVYSTQDYEPSINRILKANLRKGDIVLDIGANIGIHSVRMAKYVEGTGRVYAFEPIADIVEKLDRNIVLNKLENVVVVPVALANENKESEIHFYENHSTMNLGITSLAFKDNPNRKITIRKGDDIVNELGVKRIDFIKIDVEGFEWPAMTGLWASIKKYRPKIIFEYEAAGASKYLNVDPAAILEKFIDIGYKLYSTGRDNDVLIKNSDDFPLAGNVFAVPQ